MTAYTGSIDLSELNTGFKYNMIAYENLAVGDVVKVDANTNKVLKVTANTDIAIGVAAAATVSSYPVLVLGSGCLVQTVASLTAGNIYAPAATGALGSKGGQADQNFAVCVDGTTSLSKIRIL